MTRCPKCSYENEKPIFFCSHCGFFLGVDQRLPLEMHRFIFMRADISGFTRLSENMMPEEVMGFLNEVYGQFSKSIEKYRGIRYQIIGDEIVAIFGYPRGSGFAPHMALLAADDLLRDLLSICKKRKLKETVGLKIGVVQEPAWIYRLKGDLKDVFIVTQGFRKSQALQKNAETNTVLVCANLYASTKSFFAFREIGEFVQGSLTIPAFEYVIKGM